MAALAASARIDRTVETIENRRKIVLDAVEHKVLFEQFVLAALAEPKQAVLLVRQPTALDDQSD